MRRALSHGAFAGDGDHSRRVIDRAGAAAAEVSRELQRRTRIECVLPDEMLRIGGITAVDRQIGLAYGAAAVGRLIQGHTAEMVAIHPPHVAFVPIGEAVNHIPTVPSDSVFLLNAPALGMSLGD